MGDNVIPDKLQPYFDIAYRKDGADISLIEGTLTCCDNHNFELSAVGRIKHGILHKIALLPDDDKMILSASCKECGKDISVFDLSCDGYDNQTDNHHGQSQFNQAPVVCAACRSNNFSVRIKYEYPSAQELDSLNFADPGSAFSWIWVTLECCECGAEYKNFIDLETA